MGNGRTLKPFGAGSGDSMHTDQTPVPKQFNQQLHKHVLVPLVTKHFLVHRETELKDKGLSQRNSKPTARNEQIT